MTQTIDSLLQKAIAIALQAHHAQLDKGGHPYIGHPLRVMAQMTTPEAKIVAVLHDAIEDSDLTLTDLASHGFPPRLCRAIDALTKRDGETYETYLDRVMANPLALQVKIADMMDNSDRSRIPHPTPKDEARLQRYQHTLPRLRTALEHLNPSSSSHP